MSTTTQLPDPLKPDQTLLAVEGKIEPKPGWKTTEFWLSSIAMAISTLYASGVTTERADDSWVKAIAFVAAALTAAGYSTSRGTTKKSS